MYALCQWWKEEGGKEKEEAFNYSTLIWFHFVSWCIHEGAGDDDLWPTLKTDFILMNYESKPKMWPNQFADMKKWLYFKGRWAHFITSDESRGRLPFWFWKLPLNYRYWMVVELLMSPFHPLLLFFNLLLAIDVNEIYIKIFCSGRHRSPLVLSDSKELTTDNSK